MSNLIFPIPDDCLRVIGSNLNEIKMYELRSNCISDMQYYVLDMFEEFEILRCETDEYIVESYCSCLTDVSVKDISSFVDLIDALIGVDDPSPIHVVCAAVLSNTIKTVFDGRYGLDPQLDPESYFVTTLSYFNSVL